MKKYLIVITVIALLIGCGRVSSEDNKIKTTGKVLSNKSDFDVIVKSRFISNSSENYLTRAKSTFEVRGHYNLLFRYGGKDLEKDKLELFENGSKSPSYSSHNLSESEAEVDIDSNNNTVTNNILLLLDRSASVIRNNKRVLLDAVEQFTKDIDQSKVSMAIYYFDSRKNITPIIEHPRSIDEYKVRMDLFDRIDEKLSEFPDKYISTNLYGAVIEATDIANSWGIDDLDDMTIQDANVASVVVVTDGRDQAGWEDKNDMINVQNKQNKNFFYYAMGIGKDIDKNIIGVMSSDGKGIIIDEDRNTAELFNKSFEALSNEVNSVYEARYCPADQNDDVDIKIVLKNSNGDVLGDIIDEDVTIRENVICELPK